MFGPLLLPLYKPVGIRSTECVNRIRHALGEKIKVGHSGTLDSTAEGLLVLLIGSATRLSRLVMDLPKTYCLKLRLGAATSTDDASGEVIARGDWQRITLQQLDGLVYSFMGWREQRPPKISAVHIDGKRAHQLARSGGVFSISPKPVFIEKITRTSGISEAGDVQFTIRCHKGTYIRSFARDLGENLACFAHIRELKRVALGPFNMESSLQAEEAFALSSGELPGRCSNVSVLSEYLMSYEAGTDIGKKIRDGISVPLSYLTPHSRGYMPPGGDIIVLSVETFSVSEIREIDGVMNVCPKTNLFLGELSV